MSEIFWGVDLSSYRRSCAAKLIPEAEGVNVLGNGDDGVVTRKVCRRAGIAVVQVNRQLPARAERCMLVETADGDHGMGDKSRRQHERKSHKRRHCNGDS